MYLFIETSTDFAAVNEHDEILVFVWNSDTYLYEKVFAKTMLN